MSVHRSVVAFLVDLQLRVAGRSAGTGRVRVLVTVAHGLVLVVVLVLILDLDQLLVVVVQIDFHFVRFFAVRFQVDGVALVADAAVA